MTANATVNVTNTWEIIFGVKYLKNSYFGSIDSEVKINRGKVSYSSIFDYTDTVENKCRPCSHRNPSDDNITQAISLHDGPSKSWYKKTGEFVDIEGFQVPSVLVYPRYYISGSSETDLLVENTMCAPKGDEVCVENLPDGEYTFRVGGYAQDDEAWSFCNVSGVVGEQFVFVISGANCTVIGNKAVADHICLWGPEDDDVLASYDESLFQDEVLGGFNVVWFAEVSGVSILLIAAIILIVSKARESRSSFDALPQESEHVLMKKEILWT